MLILSCMQGPDRGRVFELPDNEPQLIGRSSEALPLTDQTISRRHCELTPDNGKWIVNDLASSNGTFVNGQRITRPRTLNPGDQIRTGNTLLLFGQESISARSKAVKMASPKEVDTSVERTVTSNDDSMLLAVTDPNEAAAKQLKVIFGLTNIIGSVFETQLLLDKIMGLIFEHFEADRGFILLQRTAEERPDPIVVKHRDQNDGGNDAPPITVSRTIVQHVMRQGEGVLSTNAMTDKRFSSGESVQAFGIRSAMCVPIKFKDRIFGVIHIDTQVANYTYTEDQLRLLTAVGVQTGLALANVDLVSERVQRERLAAVGQTVASLSHSTKNILQGMRGGADVVELGLKKDNMKLVRSGWEIVSRNLERIYALTLNMLAYSKQRRPELEMTAIGPVLEEVVELVQRQYDSKKVALLADIEPDMPPLPLDSAGVHQAVLNLLQNALDAVEAETGAVTMRCTFNAEKSCAEIQVIDNGSGIEGSVMSNLYQPFVSTKGYKGTGLGLVATKKVVDEHGGDIQCLSDPKKGTTFLIRLPSTPPTSIKSAETLGPDSGGGMGAGQRDDRRFDRL